MQDPNGWEVVNAEVTNDYVKAGTLLQKLVDIRKEIEFASKDGQGDKFAYVSHVAVLTKIRKMMDEKRVLLLPDVIKKKVTAYTDRNGVMVYFTELGILFTWIDADNPEARIVKSFYSQGIDRAGEKGVGKALTYSEKYHILRMFNVPTPKDDPDADQGDPVPRQTDAPSNGNGNGDGGFKYSKYPPPMPDWMWLKVDEIFRGEELDRAMLTRFFVNRGELEIKTGTPTDLRNLGKTIGNKIIAKPQAFVNAFEEYKVEDKNLKASEQGALPLED